MTKSQKNLCIVGVMALSVFVYGYGAWHSPQLNTETAAQSAYLKQMSQASQHNLEREKQLAEIYWRNNPDVSADLYFGKNGQLGILGAREHYKRHGQRENRTWPQRPK